MFGLPIGTNVEGKLAAALRRLGFDGVFDTDFAADLTIMEEATEFLRPGAERAATLPLITSCCPGWVKYCENFYPDFIPNLSTCKSRLSRCSAPWPRAITPRRWDCGPEGHRLWCRCMPCTAKKFEVQPGRRVRRRRGRARTWMLSLTTRELATDDQAGRTCNFNGCCPMRSSTTGHGRIATGAGRHLRRHRRRDGSGTAHRQPSCVTGKDAGEGGVRRRCAGAHGIKEAGLRDRRQDCAGCAWPQRNRPTRARCWMDVRRRQSGRITSSRSWPAQAAA